MSKKLPQNDPIGVFQRKATSERRIGLGAQCACGETQPEALIPLSEPTICAGCQRKTKGHTTMDDHHVAGNANDPTTIPTPVNDHRADLSVAQYDWPKETRENPDGSPLLRAAGCVRGFVDYLIYLLKKFVLWIPEMLEALHAFLVKKLGPKWWINTPLEQFAPKR